MGEGIDKLLAQSGKQVRSRLVRCTAAADPADKRADINASFGRAGYGGITAWESDRPSLLASLIAATPTNYPNDHGCSVFWNHTPWSRIVRRRRRFEIARGAITAELPETCRNLQPGQISVR